MFMGIATSAADMQHLGLASTQHILVCQQTLASATARLGAKDPFNRCVALKGPRLHISVMLNKKIVVMLTPLDWHPSIVDRRVPSCLACILAPLCPQGSCR